MAIFTIGHSDHSPEAFLDLLRRHGIETVADVRSAPFSRRFPVFNKESLRGVLAKSGIAYVFLGKELGARPADPSRYRDGRADYELISRSEAFRNGIERLLEEASCTRIALLCAEKEPLRCHRCILAGRVLAEQGQEVVHILADGSAERHEESMRRLLELYGKAEDDLFLSPQERVRLVCWMQERKTAHIRKNGDDGE